MAFVITRSGMTTIDSIEMYAYKSCIRHRLRRFDLLRSDLILMLEMSWKALALVMMLARAGLV